MSERNDPHALVRVTLIEVRFDADEREQREETTSEMPYAEFVNQCVRAANEINALPSQPDMVPQDMLMAAAKRWSMLCRMMGWAK